MKQMKLMDLYKSILKTANMVVDKEGFVSGKIGDQTRPVTIKGKRLVLPLRDQLQNPDWEDRLAFHPLCENILRGESQVVEKLRTLLTVRFNTVIGILMHELLDIAASQAKHSKLSPDQSMFLNTITNIDEKTVQLLPKIMEAMNMSDSKKCFVHIYLKRAGIINGTKYSRAGIVTFPFYDELRAEGNQIFGIKLRVKDKEVFTKFFEYLFPNIEDVNFYNRGSHSEVAPFIDALMKTVAAIASPINDQIDLFRDQLTVEEDLSFESDWMDSFENLSTFVPEIRAIPMLAGNEGSAVNKGIEAPGAKEQIVAQAPIHTPVATHAPVAPQPFQMPQYPVQQQQPWVQAPATPQVQNTGNGLDFGSVLRANPMLAQQVMGMNQGTQFAQQAQPLPRFAQQTPMYPGNNPSMYPGPAQGAVVGRQLI